jgi:hypothetical protein
MWNQVYIPAQNFDLEQKLLSLDPFDQKKPSCSPANEIFKVFRVKLKRYKTGRTFYAKKWQGNTNKFRDRAIHRLVNRIKEEIYLEEQHRMHHKPPYSE